MCSSVDLPAPEGATSATDCPGQIASSAPLRMFSDDVALAVVPVDAVQEQDRRRFRAGFVARLRPRPVVDRRITHIAAPRPGSRRAARQDG